jgi:hypothetical protein
MFKKIRVEITLILEIVDKIPSRMAVKKDPVEALRTE